MNHERHRSSKPTQTSSRRDFVKTPLVAGAAGACGLLASEKSPAAQQAAVIDEYDPHNTKIARRVSAKITDEELLLLKQIGLRWAGVLFGDNGDLDFMRRTQQRFERFGIRIWAGLHTGYRNLKIQLGQAGRDEYIEKYCSYLRNLGALGIPVSSYDFHPANTYSTGRTTKRGYSARLFDLKVFREKVEQQRFEREYSADEMWANYTYFVKAILPVAEQSGVTLSLHPDDPPIPEMNGVAKLFTHYEGYRRAEEIAGGSKNWGLEFCAGTWSEGGDKMGKDVFEMIRDFGARGKIFVVHFRNVTSPLPRFVETFPDDGYQDMYQVMKTLREVGYTGAAIPDHIPTLAGDEGGIRPIGTAYYIAYMRCLLRRANEEVG